MFGRRRPKSIDVLQAQAALRTGRLVLIDVREESERAREHVPGSLHVPLRLAWERHGLDVEGSAR